MGWLKDLFKYPEEDYGFCRDVVNNKLNRLDQRKKDYCTQLAYDAEEYDEYDAYSVVYILSQTHPRTVFKAFYDAVVKEL